MFKCVHGLIVDISQYVNFTEGRSRRGKTGEVSITMSMWIVNMLERPVTVILIDTYFMRITNLSNAIPEALRSAGTLKSFKRDLNNFFFSRLQIIFEGDIMLKHTRLCAPN